MDRFAVILAHNRPDELAQTVKAIGPQVDMVIVIDNASDPPIREVDLIVPGVIHSWTTALLPIPDQPPNLSALWNEGIEAALRVYEAGARFHPARIAVLCDDAPPPEGWFDAVCRAMDESGAVVGCSAPPGFGFSEPWRLKRQHDQDLMGRMPGWAWILDPASPVRADERFHWWFGDTAIDWDARLAGGMVMIGDHQVPNIHPNDFTASKPELAARVALDAQNFVDKYGSRPW